jgi:hypothetical protein
MKQCNNKRDCGLQQCWQIPIEILRRVIETRETSTIQPQIFKVCNDIAKHKTIICISG